MAKKRRMENEIHMAQIDERAEKALIDEKEEERPTSYEELLGKTSSFNQIRIKKIDSAWKRTEEVWSVKVCKVCKVNCITKDCEWREILFS